jgi:hypothetical protein
MRAGPIAVAGLLTAGALSGVVARALSRVGLHQGYAPEQPLAFSHRRHAGDSKIPCLYCHFAASRSRHAGIPPASLCMNCHGLLETPSAEVQKLKEALDQRRLVAWARVHDLPDFVAFDHSRHLLASVACEDCHGPVATMDRVRQEAPLTMGWCLECHRRRAGASLPPGSTRHQAVQAAQDCARCHY